MRPGLRRQLNAFIEPELVAKQDEKLKASVMAKVEHLVRVLERQFGYTKVRYRGLGRTSRR